MSIKRIRLEHILVFLISIMLFARCGTERNTAVSRSYHNLTSYYNILFNGKESFNEGIERYKNNYQFDFTRRLPIFIYGNEKLSGTIKSQMDRAIEKSSKLIRLHSISSKPEDLKDKRKLTKEEKEYYNKSEFNKFADDAYILMGKSYFWQMDYPTASKILEYSINTFKNEEINLKAKVWLARSYIELGKFRDAKNILEEMESMEDLPKQTKSKFYATYADFSLKQNNNEEGKRHLKQAIRNTDDKEKKIRYIFILGQLYEETDQPGEALKKYNQVLEENPDYRMKFNARLKKAWLYQPTDSRGKDVKKEIEKMLNEEKNSDYYDQIYYALAKIAQTDNQLNTAIKNYKLSAQHSKENVNQKGLSYLALADIYFNKKAYKNAQAYYDSAVTTLEKDYPGYTDLYIKNKYLTQLVSNLNTIQTQDSLQRVAQMTPEERNKHIDKLIKNYQEELKAKKKREQQIRARQQQANQYSRSQLDNFQNQNSSSWYFYSQTAVDRGESAFIQKWGERELKDNWRRSKQSSGGFEDFSSDEKEEAKEEAQLPKTNRQFYIKNLPLNDSLMEESHNKIQEAYFNVGMTYMNDLENNTKAIEAFEKLNERYPDNKYQLQSYYYLYKLNTQEGNTAIAKSYKNKIISQYPNSNYTKVLKDPDYFKKLEKEQNKIENFYSETLEAYKYGNYNKVMQNYKFAKNNFENSNHIARFHYLKALSTGKTEDIVSFRKALKEISENYPKTEVDSASQKLLSFLDKTELKQLRQHFTSNKDKKANKNTVGTQQIQSQEEESEYKTEEDEQYYFVVMVNTKNVDIGRLQFDLINFNLDYYLQKDYNTSHKNFNEYYTVITIRKFEALEDVQKYYDIIQKKEERVFSDMSQEDYNYFYISVKNYLTLIEKKSVLEYITFFKNNFASN